MITGVATGFTDLDRMTSGLQPGDLVILAARPSMGKTALALNIAEHVALRKSLPVGIFSLEMSKQQLLMRFLCAESLVDAHKVRTGYLGKDDFRQLIDASSPWAPGRRARCLNSDVEQTAQAESCRRDLRRQPPQIRELHDAVPRRTARSTRRRSGDRNVKRDRTIKNSSHRRRGHRLRLHGQGRHRGRSPPGGRGAGQVDRRRYRGRPGHRGRQPVGGEVHAVTIASADPTGGSVYAKTTPFGSSAAIRRRGLRRHAGSASRFRGQSRCGGGLRLP